ncbi:DUF418 domain-containing protein [Egibacter rhizosphaerae]|uniref:DUF418 domain-containing protein n=1 Tax=Egibacter rhizosphaerae TaxID=1670831 RepID=A0A411YIH8_9ACTN|nr:DUF418 domain-containing protein [Egibacter rhizosphaerae]QBI20951.1 DUF418 domain-containing protein [Egibacter rhizosphaerae]
MAAIDVARGVAILGIFAVNILLFAGVGAYLAPETLVDQVARGVVGAFFETKFVTQFALLFGLGLALQRSRGYAVLLRRLVVLAVIGGLHATLIWSGDILLFYAVLGLLLIPFLDRAPRTLVTWATVLISASAVVFLIAGGLFMVGEEVAGQDPEVAAELEAAEAEVAELAAEAEAAYTSRNYAEILAFRVGTELPLFAASHLSLVPMTLAMAQLGIAAVNGGVVAHLAHHGHLLRRWTRRGLAIGLPVNLLAGALVATDPAISTASGIAAFALMTAGAPFLALGYASIAARVGLARPGSGPVRAMEAVGRTALSSYLLQSLVATGVFYGFALYAQLPLVAALGFVPVMWAVNLAAATWWVRRFRFGPVEALWRAGTYGRWPSPMRVDAGADPGR